MDKKHNQTHNNKKYIYYFVFGHFFFLSVAHIANEIPMKQYQLLWNVLWFKSWGVII